MNSSERFFRDEACKYFPCHKGCDSERFNCMFCFCPLHFLGDACGGHFEYVGKDKSIKSCAKCALPHDPDYYDVIIAKLKASRGMPAK